MRLHLVTALGSILFALTLAGCTNTQPAYYGTYPSNYDFGPNHGYDAFASAPYDPYGAYYQNFGPATPYYYEPPESHRNCDERPCIAYKRNAGIEPPVAPEIIALPEKKEPFNPPSTISRTPQTRAPRHSHPRSEDDAND
jgi:hypothetical protein